MSGINKRSNDPRADQKKAKFNDLNPLYGTSSVIEYVNRALGKAMGTDTKKKKSK